MESLAARGRAVRHPHHHRQPGLLPHRAAHRGVDELRRAVDRGLRRAQTRSSVAFWKAHERQAGRRPGQARPGAAHHRRPGSGPRCASSPAPTRSPRRSRRSPTLKQQIDALPRPVDLARVRRGKGSSAKESNNENEQQDNRQPEQSPSTPSRSATFSATTVLGWEPGLSAVGPAFGRIGPF